MKAIHASSAEVRVTKELYDRQLPGQDHYLKKGGNAAAGEGGPSGQADGTQVIQGSPVQKESSKLPTDIGGHLPPGDSNAPRSKSVAKTIVIDPRPAKIGPLRIEEKYTGELSSMFKSLGRAEADKIKVISNTNA